MAPPAPLPHPGGNDCKICGQKCLSASGLTRHFNAQHLGTEPPMESLQYKREYHLQINGSCLFLFHFNISHYCIALPCNEDGEFLPVGSKPLPAASDDVDSNPWTPFNDRIEFEWAEHHFVELESSAKKIKHGLDLWQASIFHEGSLRRVPWRNAKELYKTIDSIQTGAAPWSTVHFKYNGPKPEDPPRWMLDTYELNLRDILVVAEQLLATSEFDGNFDYVPYKEFNNNNERVYSNLMSGFWVSKQAVHHFEFLIGA